MSLAAILIIVLVVCLITGYGGTRAGVDPIPLIVIILLLLLLSGGGVWYWHGW